MDFAEQLGVYLLYDRRDVVYVGRTDTRRLGKRLYEHTTDRLSGRWDRFSWFGLCPVTKEGKLGEPAIRLNDAEALTKVLEAILIEAIEPPQNRRKGDDLLAFEYTQALDPEIKKAAKRELLKEIQTKLEVD